ncbi:hypothetical protein [Arthrobacter sp. ISL-28]|uniref:hypothetical protein n=1 Tax=Arthrobacter sp. ISL-28 TaxID=2819108 RepID=UPI001BE61431|nr:hypothetical protein [Arthrobacter sp. ISL-28]MBT2520108.1 hypothetical protein [Arthrobacter sp. ISL-28]
MFRIYLSTMLLLVTAGVAFAVSATSTLVLGAGLALLTTGAGGVSAGLMTRDAKKTTRI